MRWLRGVVAFLGVAVWVGVMFLLISAGTSAEARLIFAMVMCTIMVVGALSAMSRDTPEPDAAEEMRSSCPYCAEAVKLAAVLCPHCRSDLQASEIWRLRSRAR